MLQELLNLKRLAERAPAKPRWVRTDPANHFYEEARKRVPALVDELVRYRAAEAQTAEDRKR